MSFIKEMSAREKNLWVELLIDLIVAAYYFPKMFSLTFLADDALMAVAMTALVFKTVGIAITCAIAMSIILFVLKLQETPEKADERDNQFSSKGYVVGYWVLAFCIMGLMSQIMLSEMFAEHGHWYWVLSPAFIVNLLLVALMISSATKSVTQLYLYRRGY